MSQRSSAADASASSAGTIDQPRAGASVEQRAERPAERAARCDDFLVGAFRRDLEHDPQPRGARELADQMVEDRQAGRDVGRALLRELDADSGLRVHASTRSMRAPSWRSRSSIRS